MSVEIASVLGMGFALGFLYWWAQGLQSTNVWSLGLQYLVRGTSIGLLIPLMGYVINIQTDNALAAIVTVPHAVYIWMFWLVLVFLMLNFTFDLLAKQVPGGRRR